MQFTLAVLPPNCSRCDLSMTKIQNFLGGHAPRPPDPPTRARLARHNSRQRNSSSTSCFRATPLQKNWGQPWKSKGVVSLPLDGACAVQVYSALSAICPKKLSNPPFKNPAYGPAYGCSSILGCATRRIYCVHPYVYVQANMYIGTELTLARPPN